MPKNFNAKTGQAVDYIVGECFGMQEPGTKIMAIMVVKGDDNRAILFHPASKGECASIDIAMWDSAQRAWVPYDETVISAEDGGYINLTKAAAARFYELIQKSD